MRKLLGADLTSSVDFPLKSATNLKFEVVVAIEAPVPASAVAMMPKYPPVALELADLPVLPSTSEFSGKTFLSAEMVADALTTGTPSLRIMDVPKAREEGTSFSEVSFPAEGAILSTDAQMGNIFVTAVGSGIGNAVVRSFGARIPNAIPLVHIFSVNVQVSHIDLIVSFMSIQP